MNQEIITTILLSIIFILVFVIFVIYGKLKVTNYFLETEEYKTVNNEKLIEALEETKKHQKQIINNLNYEIKRIKDR